MGPVTAWTVAVVMDAFSVACLPIIVSFARARQRKIRAHGVMSRSDLPLSAVEKRSVGGCDRQAYLMPASSGALRRGGRVSWRRVICRHRDCRGAPTIPTLPIQPVLAPGINYFFAGLPDDLTRSEIIGVSERFRKSHRVSGSSVDIDSLHLLLCPMGKPERLRQPLESALLVAADEVRGNGFEAVLDSAMRFSAKDGQFPFVLCTDSATTESALSLRKAIAAA
jgi:hypothetical protein